MANYEEMSMETDVKVTIEKVESGQYQASYQIGKLGGSQPFATYEDAVAFIRKLEDDYDRERDDA